MIMKTVIREMQWILWNHWNGLVGTDLQKKNKVVKIGKQRKAEATLENIWGQRSRDAVKRDRQVRGFSSNRKIEWEEIGEAAGPVERML